MTEGQLSALQQEIASAAFDAEQSVQASRARLALFGQRLEAIGQALQEHPEEVNPLPEPISPYDYRKEIAVLRDGEKVVKLCAELRLLMERAKTAEKRKGMLAFGSFS